MKSVYLLVFLAVHGVHHASATFSFPSFDGAQPLMSALGSMQQYLFGGGGGGGPGRVVKSAASEPAFATATVGYGTILKNPTPLVKGSPYGPPRPALRRPSRPFPRPPAASGKYGPFKGGYYPKFKPLGSHDKLKPAVVEYKLPSGAKHEPHKQFQPYDYTRSQQQAVHNSYTEAPEEATKSNAEIVQQSFRPPIHFYQQPHVATSHQVSNLNVHKAPVGHHHSYQPQQQHQQPHHRSDNVQVVDFSRPDPVFTAATMGSDWKPISSPVSRVTAPERRSDPLMHKQVESPPTIMRQYEMHKQHAIDRSGHGFVDDQPSEEIVSAVVFVKKTNDD